ncbi:MAG: helix-turn-helix domain-containing protein [Planctomycetes bacterium]|nr:helix-turn-helix domain-containing protein [Planctomycetota bacterium]
MSSPRSTCHFSGSRLSDLREEAGLSRKALAARLRLPWELISLWESSPAPDSPRALPAHEPTASQLQDLAREIDCHPSDLFANFEDAPASEKDEERAAGKASGIRLDGERLARMRKLRGLSYPQAAARARVLVAAIQAAEAGRTINTGALLRLLQVYEPGEDPVKVVSSLILARRRFRDL